MKYLIILLTLSMVACSPKVVKKEVSIGKLTTVALYQSLILPTETYVILHEKDGVTLTTYAFKNVYSKFAPHLNKQVKITALYYSFGDPDIQVEALN